MLKPMARPMLEWKIQIEAPESTMASNFLVGGECLAGRKSERAGQPTSHLRLWLLGSSCMGIALWCVK